MRIAYFSNQIAQNGHPVLAAFLQSCQHLGHEIVADSMTADAAVIWSQVWSGRMSANQQVWNTYRSSNRNVFVLEVGALQRGTTWRVGMNGVNGVAEFGSGPIDTTRAAALGLKLLPWRHSGDHVMICTQRSDSQQWSGMPSLETWVSNTIDTIQQHSDRPIVIRSHPRFRLKVTWPNTVQQIPKHLNGTYDCFDFEASLASAWAVVNWNSNPGVQAIINGVPAFVGASSLAAPVANLSLIDIESPQRPDRQAWLDHLAHTEWTIDEIQQGIPLLRLMLSQPGQTSI